MLKVQRLSSGFVRVVWPNGQWAQFEYGKYPKYDDFFQPSWSFSAAKAHEAYEAVQAAGPAAEQE